jgi:P-type Ca2+ transporter type 2C
VHGPEGWGGATSSMRLPVPTSRLPVPSGPARGLSSSEVEERRRRFGSNALVERPRQGGWALARETAGDPMLWFLVGTAGLHGVLGQVTEAWVLLLALVPLLGMDALLHRRTRASTEGLRGRLAAYATVLREGRTPRVPAEEVVVGDLVRVEAGESFPADGLVVEGEGLQVEESSLTGEAYPVRKHPVVWPLPPGEEPRVEGRHWGLAGTRLLTGRAWVRVVFTGEETLYGHIVRLAERGRRGRTPLQGAVASLVGVLAVVAAGLCAALAFVRWRQGHGWADALVSAATLAVAALPEEFPVALTFFLGAGVYRLARRQALVRRAVSVENIGRVTTLCTDKTGTLTEGRPRVARVLPVEGGTAAGLLRVAAGASRREGGDPLDAALLDEAARSGVGREGLEVVATHPFTEERRREVAVVREGRRLRFLMKGAPERVLAGCELEEEERAEQLARVVALAREGRKVIACASQEMEEAAWRGGEPERGWRLEGLVACEDPVRAGVAQAVRACREAGIHTLMVTGDHPVTARAVARVLGLGGEAPVLLTGEEVEALVSRGDGERLREVDVIARALPAQKLALVTALRRAGEVVVVTGDGVNDVPALQAADVGVAMGERGTRSAREVASIVLLDDDFRTLVGAIAEGRQLFRNLRASFAYLLLVHIPLVVTAALIPLAGYPLLYLPIHIVWVELVIHPTALLVFQAGARTERLERQPRLREARFFTRGDWGEILLAGVLMTGVVVWGYDRSLGSSGEVAHARAVALVSLVAASAFFAGWLSRLRTRTSRWVVGLTLGVSVLLVQVPAVAATLGVTPLHGDDWARAVGGAAVATLPLVMRSWVTGRPSLALRERGGLRVPRTSS